METCPYLPPADVSMSYRCLTSSRTGEVGVFYENALKYGHYLWLKGHAGRAVLAITRALYADVPEDTPVLREWPLPYRALYWIVKIIPVMIFPEIHG